MPDAAPDAGLLRREPPHWVARGLAYILILVFGGAITGSVLVQVPETISSPFVLVPVAGSDPVRSSRDGTVAEVRIAEGQTVADGQPMFVVRSAAVGDRTAELQTVDARLAGAAERLANVRQAYESQRAADLQEARRLEERRGHVGQKVDSHRALRAVRETKYRTSLLAAETEVASARSEVAFKKEHLALAQELAERFRKGYEGGHLSWIEYIRPQIDARKTAVDLEQLERQLGIAELKVAQLRTEHEGQEVESKLTLEQLEAERLETQAALAKIPHEMTARRAEFAETERRLGEEVDTARIRKAALEGALTHARGSLQSVLAPCAGTVLRLAVRAPGAVVREGELLSELACATSRLQAELTLPLSGVGRVKTGLGVKLLYDAFPYERYGARHGVVRWVSPASVETKDGPAFRAIADVTEHTIRVDGQARALAPGMGGKAQIVVGRRSILSYAFEPLRRLKENLAGPPGS